MYQREPQDFSRVGTIPIGAKRIRHADQDGTARLAVHFQSVTEKFSPHDTIFSFTAASELVDPALSAACSLHTAPASIKSSTSLRQKGLAGITEDAGENQTIVSPDASTEQEAAKISGVKESSTGLDGRESTPSPPIEQRSSPAPSSRTVRNTDKALPPTPDSPNEDERPKRSVDHDEFLLRSSFEGRHSSQSARPTTREGYNAYEYKPKVKLGPRPSLDSNGGVLSSDPASRTYDPRPVATLPASVRMPSRKVVPPKPIPPRRQTPPALPQSAGSQSTVTHTVTSGSGSVISNGTVLPQRHTPKLINTMPIRSAGTESKMPAMTPEKKRLMKALELRQKQIAAQKRDPGPESEGLPVQLEQMTAPKPLQDDDLIRYSEEAAEALENPIAFQTALRDNDLGVVHIGNVHLAQRNSAKLDISPISAPEASDGPSTQASSVSEEGSFCNEKQENHQTELRLEGPGATDDDPLSQGLDNADDDFKKALTQMQGDCGPGRRKLDAATEPQSDSTAQHEDVPYPQELASAQEDPCPSNHDGEHEGPILTPKAGFLIGDLRNNFDTSPSGQRAVEMLPSVVLESTDEKSDDPSRESQHALSRQTNHEKDSINPHEVPLPAITEDEGMPLSLERASTTGYEASTDRGTQHSPPSGSHPREEDDQHIQAGASTETRPLSVDTAGNRHGVRQNRRHGLVEPVRRISSGENSDDQFLSDDSFMEELKSATVQEAKPISVSKSPITPVFPRSELSESKATRSVSTPLQTDITKNIEVYPETSTHLSPRSVSLSKTRSISPSNDSPPMLGKVGVSSGISQRIKALEKLQSRPTSPSSQLSSPAAATSPFATLGSRKSSFRSHPGTSDRPNSRQALLLPTPIICPTTNFEVAHPKPYNQFVSVKVASKPGKSRPESISVTARIVRDERNQTPEVPRDASEPRVMDLHHSPLKVEHKPDVKSSSSKKPPMKRHSTAPSVSSNSTDHRSEPVTSSKRESLASASNGSRRGSDTELPRSVSELSLSGINCGDGVKEEKKESRKSRLLKRMSNSMAASRRSIATALSPPPVREESIAEQNEPLHEMPSATVEIGDVNIQFPDTLVSLLHSVTDLLLISQISSGNAGTWPSTLKGPWSCLPRKLTVILESSPNDSLSPSSSPPISRTKIVRKCPTV